MPLNAPYESIKPVFVISEGEIAHCNKNEKQRIESISGCFVPAIAAIIVSIVQINALKSDGEKPANHTKPIKAIMRSINVSFLMPALFPKNNAIAENIERCIPERARICERPARRNAS